MFKFFDEKGHEVFSSKSLKEVVYEAKIYKKKNNIPALAICRSKGQFHKWA